MEGEKGEMVNEWQENLVGSEMSVERCFVVMLSMSGYTPTDFWSLTDIQFSNKTNYLNYTFSPLIF